MTAEPSGVLTAALGVDGGIVCAVGAGGKKSLLYALAREARGRVGVTATVTTFPFPRWLDAQVVIDDEPALRRTLAQPAGPGVTAYACPSGKHARLAGLAPETVTEIHDAGAFDLTLVKADGARMRGIKAPRPGEPVLPPATVRVLPVVSANVIGQPLDGDVAHRPDRLAQLLGVPPETTLTAEHVGRLLASEQGGLQATGDVPVVPVINQVDDAQRLQQARVAANVALALGNRFDRVVLTCLRRDNPWVETVFRQPI